MQIQSLIKPNLLHRSLVVWSLMAGAAACSSTNARPPVKAGQQTDPVAAAQPAPAATQPTTAQSAKAPATQPAADTPMAKALRASVYYLASEELEGRGIGSPGLDLAASYIAGNFQAAGLQPVPGMSDYFQRFDSVSADSISPETTLAAGETRYIPGKTFTALSFSAEKAFSGDVVFVGYGITDPEHKYDDYAGIDVRGKVVLAWRFEPVDDKGHSRFTKPKDGNGAPPKDAKSEQEWSDLATFGNKAKNAAEHGAAALLLFNPPSFTEQDSLLPFSKMMNMSVAPIPVLQLTRTAAEALLTRGGVDDKGTARQIDAELVPRSQSLSGVALSGNVVLKRTVRHLKNVMGCVPGQGPHADEYVVVSSHYDHLGHGGFGSLAPFSHDIHHGADDNASGTACVMQLAKLFAGASPPPQRSIIFVTFTGEEMGLLGSQHFVANCPVPLTQIVADLNMDMVGRLRKDDLYVGGTGTAPSFDAILKQADDGLKLNIKDAGRGGLGPSDHMSFGLKKVPVLFLFTGMHADYHRPTDTADKINYNGMAQIVALARRVTAALAEMPREQYVSKFDSQSMTMSGSHGGGSKVTLGVMPDYASTDIKGLRITGTIEDSPAQKAGLKEGDVIIGWNERAVDNIEDLMSGLSRGKPGDKVKLKVRRGNEVLTLDATLKERR